MVEAQVEPDIVFFVDFDIYIATVVDVFGAEPIAEIATKRYRFRQLLVASQT